MMSEERKALRENHKHYRTVRIHVERYPKELSAWRVRLIKQAIWAKWIIIASLGRVWISIYGPFRYWDGGCPKCEETL